MKKTIYDLFDIAENASKDEIEEAYSKLVYEYRQDPSNDEATNKENEMIVNRLKIGYEILIDPQKRKAYDSKIAQERANDLLSQVQVSTPKEEAPAPAEEVVEEKPAQPVGVKITEAKQQAINEIPDDEVPAQNNQAGLTSDERQRIQDAAREEFDNNLQRAKQAEQEYKEAYTKAYNNYIKNEKKEVLKGKLRKIKTTAIVIFAVVLTCFIMWLIPPVRKMLTDLYNDNTFVRIVVDLIRGLFSAIFSIFKK